MRQYLQSRRLIAPTRWTLLGAVFALASGCARPDPDPGGQASAPPPAPATVAAPVAPVAPVVETVTRGWSPKESYSYRLKLTTTIAMGDGPKGFDFELTGNPVVLPASVTGDETILYLSIPDAGIVSRIPASQPELDKAAAEIRNSGIFFTLAHGKLGELRIPKGQSPLVTNSYRSVASALQFAHARGDAKKYGAEEFDTTGRAVVEYEADTDPSLWKKKKLRYLSVLGASKPVELSGIPLLPDVTSDGRVRLSPTGRPLSVDLRETMLVQGAQMPIRSEVTVSLSSSAEHPAPSPTPDWQAKLASAERLPADRAAGVAAPVENLDAARIGSLTFEQILSGLEQNTKAKSARKAQRDLADKDTSGSVTDEEQAERETELHEDSRLFFALAAMFRSEPRTIGRAVKAIHEKSPAARSLMDALSSSGSDAAQEALVTLTETKSVGDDTRDYAAIALSRTATPSLSSIRAFKALLRADPFGRPGLYGLGTFARRLRDEGKASEANKLGEFLVARLKQAKNDTDLVTVLRSIANSGYAPGLRSVTPYLADDRDKVRSAAVRALQSMRDPQVDGIIASRLKEDASSVVRLSALDAARVREPSPVLTEALANVATEAADTHVRFRAVELMISWLPRSPALRATLELVAKNDAEPKVRNRAQAAL